MLTPSLSARALWQGDTIVVCGVNHCTFYTLQGANLVRRAASLGSKGEMGKMMCVAWAVNDAVVGTSSGKLYKFKDHVLTSVFNAHTGAVMCCFSTRNGIATGGRDGTIKLWSSGLDMQVRGIDTRHRHTHALSRTVRYTLELPSSAIIVAAAVTPSLCGRCHSHVSTCGGG